MTRLMHVMVFAALVAAATALAGWWTVPLVTAVWVRVFPRAPVRTSMAGAALAWGGLIGWTAWHAPVLLLAHRVAGVFHLPPWGPLALTLLFPALLAGTTARGVQPSPFR